MKGDVSMTLYDEKTKALLAWLAGIGAAALGEVAQAAGLSVAAAGSRVRRLERDGLVRTVRLLHGEPALCVVTRGGLRAAGRPELAPPRVSHSGFAHLLECGRVAVALERAVGDAFSVHSEREIRAWERSSGVAFASAELGFSAVGAAELHRPDLACCALDRGRWPLPVVIEVELTVKAPARLREIVRGWARSRRVAGVVYYAAPAALRALERAVVDERAVEQVHVLALAEMGELPRGLVVERSPGRA
jgi:DNA-binding Lrp family transcriptional regulator